MLQSLTSVRSPERDSPERQQGEREGGGEAADPEAEGGHGLAGRIPAVVKNEKGGRERFM